MSTESPRTEELEFARLVEGAVRSAVEVNAAAYDVETSVLAVRGPQGMRRVELREPFGRYHEAPEGQRGAVIREIVELFTNDDTLESASQPGDMPSSASIVGETLGGIRIVEILGRGGFGDVYLGQDEKLGRRVAVKALRRDRSEPANRDRQAREARILSRFNHPNVCQIYELLEREEADFLILEYIDGQKLSELRGRLGKAEKERLAEQLVEVLVFAHSRWIVHRDLKPANIMVTKERTLKVLDFGLARLAELELAPTLTMDGSLLSQRANGTLEPGVTRAGTVLGTPGYMSPEQARGEMATPASDMFSLGLVLQELFTDRLPFDPQRPNQELMAQRMAGLSSSVEGLGRELTTLIEELRSPNPDDRPTASDTLRRLRAIRDAPARRLRRTGVAVTIVLALSAGAKYTVDLRRSREAALAASNEALAAQGELEELMSFMLEDLYRGLEPLGRLDLLDSVAEKTLSYYDSAAADDGVVANPHRRAAALANTGWVLHMRGDFATALESLGRARELAEQNLSATPDDVASLELLFEIDYKIGSLRRWRGDLESAIESLRSAESRYDQLPPALQREPGAQERLALTLSHLGTSYAYRGEFDESLRYYERSRILLEAMVDGDANPQHWAALADIYKGIGDTLSWEGSLEEAIEHLTRAEATYRRAVELDETDLLAARGHATALGRLGETLELAGRGAEAQEVLSRALRLIQRLVEKDPGDLRWQQEEAVAHGRLASRYMAAGRAAIAEEHLEKAIRIEEQLHATDPTIVEWANNLAYDLIQLGKLAQDEGRDGSARRSWRRAVDALEPLIEESTAPQCVDTYAIALLHLGRGDDALPWLRLLRQAGWPGPEVFDLARERGIATE